MAKLPASLLFACLLTLGAGCLGDSDPAADAADLPSEETPAPAAVAAAPAEDLPECPKNHSNNYGSSFTIDGHYIVSPAGDDVIIYYQESNGCGGMQTKEAWPHNPDTKVAAVPYPVAPNF